MNHVSLNVTPPVEMNANSCCGHALLITTRKMSKEERRIGVDPPPPKAGPNAEFEVGQTISEKGGAPSGRPSAKAANIALARSKDDNPRGSQKSQSRAEPAGAGALQRSFVGALGYLVHGVTFLTLALLALVHFGQVFWFLATCDL